MSLYLDSELYCCHQCDTMRWVKQIRNYKAGRIFYPLKNVNHSESRLCCKFNINMINKFMLYTGRTQNLPLAYSHNKFQEFRAARYIVCFTLFFCLKCISTLFSFVFNSSSLTFFFIKNFPYFHILIINSSFQTIWSCVIKSNTFVPK